MELVLDEIILRRLLLTVANFFLQIKQFFKSH